MDVDDLLFQMKLKMWDEPLDFAKFANCVRLMDPSFSDSQLKALFAKLKNNEDNKVNVEQMMINFVGSMQDTVDYKVKVLKVLYSEIY